MNTEDDYSSIQFACLLCHGNSGGRLILCASISGTCQSWNRGNGKERGWSSRVREARPEQLPEMDVVPPPPAMETSAKRIASPPTLDNPRDSSAPSL